MAAGVDRMHLRVHSGHMTTMSVLGDKIRIGDVLYVNGVKYGKVVRIQKVRQKVPGGGSFTTILVTVGGGNLARCSPISKYTVER